MTAIGDRKTLIDLLRARARTTPDAVAFRYLPSGDGPADGGEDEVVLTYAELDRRARRIGHRLAGPAGRTALLLYPAGLEFVAAFFGCLYAGVVAVPAYPHHNAPRLGMIAADCGARVVLTTRSQLRVADRYTRRIPQLADAEWLATDGDPVGDEHGWTHPGVGADALAFLQYTSGSTAAPKGVMVSHANILANERLIAEGFGVSASTPVVGWLPLYHDMGLIGNILQPLYQGAPCTLMSPMAFLQRPARWLRAVSRYGAVVSGGPNFAYDLCTRRIRPEEIEGIDLSGWTVAFNGAEPVRAETMAAFTARFAGYGFRPESFYPCYGLAEATLFVAGPRQQDPPTALMVDTTALETHRIVEATTGRLLVSSGHPREHVAIVDPQTATSLPEDRVGEVWVAGPSVSRGYWDKTEINARNFHARADGGTTPFLRTGDLGFLHGGELFVTGRLKDMVIVRGRNIYPQDVELTAERAHAAVVTGCTAAFAVEVDGQERLAVAAEAELSLAGTAEEILDAITRAVLAEHDVAPYTVVLLRPRTIPKTSSGKIQRHACRTGLAEGTLTVLAGAVAGEHGMTTPGGPVGLDPLAELIAADAPTRRVLLDRLVRRELARAAQLAPDGVDARTTPAAVGLDSLAAVEFQARLEQLLDVTLPAGSFARQPSVTDVVDEIAAAMKTPTTREYVRPAPATAPALASPGQERLWFLDRLAPGTAAYTVHFGIHVSGPLDDAALGAAVSEVVRRHTVLRTGFQQTDDGLRQVVRRPRPIPLNLVDLTGVADPEQRLRRTATELAAAPFDLTTDALVRWQLVRFADTEHALVIAAHHTITDGWSASVLGTELAEVYTALVEGGPLPSHPVLQFSDYAHWVRDHADRLDESRAFWARQLAGIERLALPGDRPRGSSRSHRGGRVDVVVPAQVADRLVEVGKAEGCTPFITLLSAYVVLLRRHSGQHDLTVGTVVANRNHPELRGVLGFLANTVVMRCDTSGAPGFRALLGRVREAFSSCVEHSELPFSEIVRAAGGGGRGEDAPLFDANFVLESTPRPLADVAGTIWTPLSWSPDGAVEGTAKFELSLALRAADDGYRGVLEYDADRFDHATAERMVAQFNLLLAGLALDLDRPVTTVELLPATQRRAVLHDWNDTAADIPARTGFPALFEERVREHPERVAARCGDGQLTYVELNAAANRLAHHLRGRGIGRDTVVGLLMPRSLEFLTCVLAVFKAGAAYVPLDPDHPAHRHRQVLDGARVPLLIGTPELVVGLADRCDVLTTAELPAVTGPDTDPGLPVRPDDLAYVIFTSGSTGEPKGAMVEQLGMVNHLYAKVRDLDLGCEDTVAQTASQCFDISVWQFLSALLVGGQVDVVDQPTATDPARLFAHAAASDITVLEVVPSLLRTALDVDCVPPLPLLRWLVVTGEAFPPELARRWQARFPGIPQLNAYGPTECADDVAHYAIHGPESLDVATVPIGVPVLNTRLYVLDEHMSPVPVGVLGELAVAGHGVGRGYIGRPDLTAERFAPDPFGAPGSRLYRTGDLARWLPDGRVEFAGRVDDQIKVRGFRIELGEVETVLAEHPAVRDAAVAVHETPAGEHHLVGYVVLDGADTESLTAWAGTRLPAYMVPALLVELDRLPLTPNGKLDRKALPAVAMTATTRAHRAPSTPTEDLLAGVWAQVLGVERVGVDDDFLALGGHSLLATRVVGRVRSVLGVEVPLRQLFDARTVAGLAVVVDELSARGPTRLPDIAPAVPRIAPVMSSAQRRLWFLDQLNPGDPSYNMPGAVRVRGRLDVEALKAALREVVRRHEALRTSFVPDGADAVPVVATEADLPLNVVDAATETEVDAQIAAMAREPFDLAAGPLVRARLLRLAPQEHVLVVVLHHIVSDGWSLGVLIREVSALYTAFRDGLPSPLHELPVQYADYAVWQRDELAPVLDTQVEYWRTRLAGAPPLLELPTDRPRHGDRRGRGAQVPVTFDAELIAGLRALARAEGATLFMVLLAGFQALLSRLSGQDDVVVGSPVAGRTRPELEDLIGLFVNTLVLRGDLSDDPGFDELLHRVRESTLDAYAHQDVPFEKLVEVLDPVRDLSRTPLFQVMFVLQNAPAGELDLGGAEVEPLPVAATTAKYDLTLSLQEHDEVGVDGFLEYDTDLIDTTTATTLVTALGALLTAAVADPTRPVGTLPLLTARERRRVLVDWNATTTDVPDATIHDLFAAQVRRTPDAVALHHGDRVSTYRDLDTRANQIAHLLLETGDSPVGVHLPRSIDLVAAQLGALKAGRPFVCLDPAYPAERLRTMVSVAGITTVLTAGTDPGFGPDVATTDITGFAVAARPRHDPGVPTHPDDAAYVIFTSGSTGTPNGVVGTHKGAVNRMAWMWRTYPFADDEVSAIKTSPNFVDSIWETFGPLLAGVRSTVVDDDVVRSPAQLLSTLESAGVTRIVLVPTLIRALLAVDTLAARTTPLRYLVSSGEELAPELLGALRERLPDRTVLNLYGSSEAAADSLAFDTEDWDGGRVPLGSPIANTRVYLLDEAFQPVPVGVPGHVHLAGHGLARGYLGRPDLTAQRFVPDPFGAPGGRLYRTGDLGRWRPDGRVDFIGRVDHQVKVRGFRIELGEVTAALQSHPEVGQAVVVVGTTPAGEPGLVGYVVPRDAARPVGTGALRDWAAARLPRHMVPTALRELDRLPLTPNGKLDRRALPAVDVAEASTRYTAPSTPTEDLLARVWAEVLGAERVGVDDDFFDLGGHSLLATQVLARVRDALGVEPALRQLFSLRTVARLAEVIDSAADTRTGTGRVVPVDRDGPLPLSFAQRRLWFLDRLAPGDPTYNVPGALRVRGPLDVGALGAALREVVRRHEVLRTVLVDEGPEPVQVVRPDINLVLETVEVDSAADVEVLVAAVALESFDLASGPLMRARLLRLGPQEHVLVVVLHHIVSDGWSLGVLIREVSALYAAFREGLPSPLPELPVQYADYAVWQRDELATVLDAQIEYWRIRLAGAPTALELPTDFPRPPTRRGCGAHIPVTLDADLVAGLRRVARAEGATLFMVLLAGFQALLSRYSGQDEVLVGTPVAGRPRLELEGLIGFFVNTLVLRGDLTGQPGFGELVGRARKSTVDAHAHQDVPFERLVEALDPSRDPTRTPLVQAVFTLQNATADEPGLDGALVEPLAIDTATAKFDLTLSLGEVDDAVEGYLEYDTDLFRPGTAADLVNALHTLLAAAVADPVRPVAALPLLTTAQRHRIVHEWNDTARVLPGRSVHALFEARTRSDPRATALVQHDRVVTYGELDRWAGRIAGALTARGLRPEDVVAVALPRGVEAIAGALGVLKAGGAYLPLDLSTPADRVAFLLADANAAAVLTDRPHLVPPTSATVLTPDQADHAEEVSVPAGDERLAYLMYTSGSTGQPKAVAVPHRAVVRLALATGYADLGSPDTVLHLAPPFFDAATFEIWAPLLAGARVAVADPDPLSLAEVAALVDEYATTALWLTAPLFHQMVEHHLESFGRLRYLLAGGDVLSPRHVRAVRDRYPDLRLVNGYGPTENTTFTTTETVGAVHGPIPIGRPLDNTTVYVLDQRAEPVPVGVVGELHTGGLGLARGYLGSPDLTAQRFVPDPFGGPGSRLYRTGDLARWLPDGRLEFVGRADTQVKLRGFRVEPGEIAAALAEHPTVTDAAVVVDDLPTGDRRLVGYAVAGGTTPALLRDWLTTRLPGYAVPAAVVVVEELPLTATGKLDRAALPPVRWDRAPSRAPRGALEEDLASVWAQVLGRDGIGAEEDFFALGGHSLLATQVIGHVRARWGVEVPLRALFDAPTVAGLARAVREGTGRGGSRLPAITRADRSSPAPASSAQRRLWFLDQLNPRDTAYIVPAAVRVRGSMDAGALEIALREVVRRHEVLRTRFTAVDSEPVQVIDPETEITVEVVDVPAADLDREISALVEEPFDLAVGPLLRTRLLRVAPDDHVLVLTLHHIVFDGWSTGVLLRDLSTAYAAARSGSAPRLSEPAVQYADYALWQQRTLALLTDEQVEHWRVRLAGAPPALALPTDFPRAGLRRGVGAREPVVLDADLVAGLRELGRGGGATLFMVLLAGFQALLSRLSGQEDVVVGSPVAGRTRPELEDLIGFFVNTVVLRGDLTGTPSFEDFLSRVRESTLDAYAHQDVPFEKLVEVLDPVRDLSRTPLFQVMFVLQNARAGELDLGGAEVEVLPIGTATAKFDLTLSLQEVGDRVEGHLEYDADLFRSTTAATLVSALHTLLTSAVADPTRPVADLPLHAASAREQALAEGTGEPAAFPDAAVHELFEHHAAATPEALAVVGLHRALTYDEVNAQANRLARALAGLGAGPETTVAILVEPDPEMLPGLLGVLKTGAAYLPLDPQLPPRRIRQLLSEAGPVAVLAARALADRCPVSVPLVVLEDAWADLAGTDATDPGVAVHPANAAYVLYTSGSTGEPKGVVVEHRQLVAYATAITWRFGLRPGMSYAMLQPLSVDSCLTVLAPALTSGGTLHVLPRAHATDPDAVLAHMRAHPVDVLKITPSHLAALIEDVPTADLLPRHILALGGEGTQSEWLRQTLAPLVPGEVHIHYGPTETTVGVLTGPAEPDPSTPLVPLGHPLPGTRVHVLDASLRPVPTGVVGEIHIGGVGVARGYLGRPDLTAASFLPDPHSPEPGDRLYRTGDLARRLPDGRVVFLGRTDHQVKVRGFRVEPAEVDAALRAHPAVRAAATTGRERHGLVSYVVPADGAGGMAEELRVYLRELLPAHMVPTAVVELPRLPLTAQGKVDHSALPEPDDRPDAARRAPRTPLEVRLAAVFAEVLGLEVDRIGADDDFFALGGHSLLAVRLRTLVRHRLPNVDLPLDLLFRAPTVARLARALTADTDPDRALVTLRRGTGDTPLVLVHPIGGELLPYADLVRALGAERPVLGLRASATATATGEPTLTDIAAGYVHELDTARPGGRLVLAGWSTGGLLAHEIARQLGPDRVAAVVLFDTHLPPGDRSPLPDDALPPAVRFAAEMARLTGADIDALAPRFLDAGPDGRRAELLAALTSAGVLAPDEPERDLDTRLAAYTRDATAVAGHRLRPTPVPVVLYIAVGSTVTAHDWRPWSGAVRAVAVDGDHHHMLRDPAAAGIAADLRGYLEGDTGR